MFLRIDAGLTPDCVFASPEAPQNDKLQMTADKSQELPRPMRFDIWHLSFVICHPAELRARMSP
jgi:hypothetical protein